MLGEADYVAHTNYSFILRETVEIAKLIEQGVSSEEIRDIAIDRDLFELRAIASRQRALQTIQKRLRSVASPYIELLAKGNSDIQRFTNLFIILRENRLLQELIKEVLLSKLKNFEKRIFKTDLQIFFTAKREQSSTIAAWSESTYQKTQSNTLKILTEAGFLKSITPRGSYEIYALPVPLPLQQQLKSDGLEHFLILMLNPINN
ncbi:BrxA family protein [Spirulina sp. 06S082]|uniref:BrxA family protein n=1 Tax=Spirulina sp. 06S082 TaxID=3110248 RepID=UPI002B2105F0|nr:BrxA family protein [Spirulina sp. 06S082]MEA5468525.1 BrxA family protein [Spirulina sp. 06S082]